MNSYLYFAALLKFMDNSRIGMCQQSPLTLSRARSALSSSIFALSGKTPLSISSSPASELAVKVISIRDYPSLRHSDSA